MYSGACSWASLKKEVMTKESCFCRLKSFFLSQYLSVSHPFFPLNIPTCIWFFTRVFLSHPHSFCSHNFSLTSHIPSSSLPSPKGLAFELHHSINYSFTFTTHGKFSNNFHCSHHSFHLHHITPQINHLNSPNPSPLAFIPCVCLICICWHWHYYSIKARPSLSPNLLSCLSSYAPQVLPPFSL